MIVFTLYALALHCVSESKAVSLRGDAEKMNFASKTTAREAWGEGRDHVLVAAEDKRGAWERESICRQICAFCGRHMARRVSALCSDECQWNGDSYRACFTLWSISQYNARGQ
ncbi:hypothetical protein LSAT2_023271 [Lamellibrachia satsuma]|nr:hypothetical protein LSAT2_023271 [Lamellibrachia satsuma]